MSEEPLAKLRFISWASRGAIRLIHEEGNNDQTKPGQFNVEFDVRNDKTKINNTVGVPVQLYGPENITGIDQRQVIRTFPPHLSSDNESNYFASLEFDSSFLGWIVSLKQAIKKTQDEPKKSILEPSFVLAVVPRDKEGIKLTIDPESKLQVLEFDGNNAIASQELPIIEEAYYWTHIQTLTTTNEESKEFDETSKVDNDMMRNILKRDDINTICRIISPRRLKPGTSYYGCLLSIYKATNKIIDPNISVNDTNKLQYAWDDSTSSGKFLVFYSFEFTTDPEPGDFETLVRRLKPRTLPPKVGTRFMAVPPLSTNYPCYGQTTSFLPPPEENIAHKTTLEDDNASNQILLAGQRVSLNNEIIKNIVKVRLKKIISQEDNAEEGSLTLQIIRPPGKPDFVEDFQKDDSWKSNDASIAVNISEKALKFDVKQDNTNDACSYDLDEAASNNKWILRFQLEITNVSNNSRLLVGLADNDFNLGADAAQNFLGMQLTQTRFINGILPIYAENFPPQQEEERVEYFDDFTLSSGRIFYLEISRLSSTSFVIRRYADPNYKQVIESLERSCPGSLQNLKSIKLMNFVTNETEGALQGKIKHLRFWNNLNEINPEGEIIAKSNNTIATSDISSEFDNYQFDLGDDIKYPPIHGDVIVAVKKSEPLGVKIQIAKYNNKDIRGVATRFEDGEWIDYSNNFDHGFEISYSLEGLGLEGALRSPLTKSTSWPDTEGSRYQDRLKTILNENNELLSVFSDVEPKVLPPLYGSRQAAENEISENMHHWFSTLNMDPRNRAIAGLGTLVVNDQQEQLREAAWQMIDEIENINQTLRQGQLSRSVSFGLNQWIKDLSLDSFMMITNPVHNKILDNDKKSTMQNKIKSKLGNGILSPTFRKITNPTGPIGKKIFGDDDSLSANDDENLTYKINEQPDFLPFSSNYKGMGGMISVYDLEKYIDSDAPSEARDIIDDLKDALIPDRNSDFDNTTIGQIDCNAISSSGITFEITPDFDRIGVPGVWVVDTSASVGDTGVSLSGTNVSGGGTGVSNSGTGLSDRHPNLSLSDIVDVSNTGTTASNLVVNFCNSVKIHQKEIHKQLVKTITPPSPPPLDLEEIRETIEERLNPEYTIQKRILNRIDIGDVEWNSEDPLEQMTVCIEFPQPMWGPLANISQELLIPGIEYMPQNTIALLVENPSFIESYMVGLNNAFSSEALWHKIPVSLTCSFFRQFWDKGIDSLPDDKELELKVINELNITESKPYSEQTLNKISDGVEGKISDEIEKQKDIDHIHKWSYKQLGHNYRQPGTPRVILLIRGELLRKYPNSVIYAVKGEFHNGEIKFPSQIDKIKLPKFRIFLKPDITFFGFDLNKKEVKGEPNDRNNPGYFFVIQEQPSELSFKLDESDKVSTDAEIIRDLSWYDFENDREFNYLSIKDTKDIVESHPRLSDDEKNKWDSNSAQVAYNLLKRPIRVAIHASQMLEGVI